MQKMNTYDGIAPVSSDKWTRVNAGKIFATAAAAARSRGSRIRRKGRLAAKANANSVENSIPVCSHLFVRSELSLTYNLTHLKDSEEHTFQKCFRYLRQIVPRSIQPDIS
jgi:hypothetical protein